MSTETMIQRLLYGDEGSPTAWKEEEQELERFLRWSINQFKSYEEAAKQLAARKNNDE